MSNFQKTVFTVVLVTAFGAVPAISHGKEVCYTVDGKQHCFDFVCQPTEPAGMGHMDVEDPAICVMVGARHQGASSRKEILERITNDCINAGGILEDKGSKVTCFLHRPKLRKQVEKTRTEQKQRKR